MLQCRSKAFTRPSSFLLFRQFMRTCTRGCGPRSAATGARPSTSSARWAGPPPPPSCERAARLGVCLHAGRQHRQRTSPVKLLLPLLQLIHGRIRRGHPASASAQGHRDGGRGDGSSTGSGGCRSSRQFPHKMEAGWMCPAHFSSPAGLGLGCERCGASQAGGVAKPCSPNSPESPCWARAHAGHRMRPDKRAVAQCAFLFVPTTEACYDTIGGIRTLAMSSPALQEAWRAAVGPGQSGQIALWTRHIPDALKSGQGGAHRKDRGVWGLQTRQGKSCMPAGSEGGTQGHRARSGMPPCAGEEAAALAYASVPRLAGSRKLRKLSSPAIAAGLAEPGFRKAFAGTLLKQDARHAPPNVRLPRQREGNGVLIPVWAWMQEPDVHARGRANAGDSCWV